MKDIFLQKKLNCSASEAWKMWTNPSLLNTFFGIECKVDLREGGPFEIYFSKTAALGERGSENCTIISFKKNKNLNFTWNAPPSIPKARNSGHFTQVNLSFNKVDKGICILILEHSGWDFIGEHWEKTNVYFNQAWPDVLEQMELALNQKK